MSVGNQDLEQKVKEMEMFFKNKLVDQGRVIQKLQQNVDSLPEMKRELQIHKEQLIDKTEVKDFQDLEMKVTGQYATIAQINELRGVVSMKAEYIDLNTLVRNNAKAADKLDSNILETKKVAKTLKDFIDEYNLKNNILGDQTNSFQNTIDDLKKQISEIKAEINVRDESQLN